MTLEKPRSKAFTALPVILFYMRASDIKSQCGRWLVGGGIALVLSIPSSLLLHQRSNTNSLFLYGSLLCSSSSMLRSVSFPVR